jgi:eukaryotic-like serine/threonine-protein kinase
VDVSPDGRLVVTGGFFYPGGAKVWDARSGALVKDLPGGTFCGPIFSPDGRRLLTGAVAAVRPIRLWDTATWAEVPFAEPIEGKNAAFSPDGKLLVFETGTGVACLVDPESGREYARLEDPNQDRASDFAFSPDGTNLVSTTTDGFCVHVWDLRAMRRQLASMNLDW